MVFQRELTLHTHSAGEMHDLTDAVTRIVNELGVRTGIVFNVGSTGAIGAIEFEPGLEQDPPALLRRLIPPSRDYAHEQAWHGQWPFPPASDAAQSELDGARA